MTARNGTGTPSVIRIYPASITNPVLRTGSHDPLERHLRHLYLSGRSPGTIYQRRRLLIRTARVLPVPLTEVTRGHLADWRDSLTVSRTRRRRMSPTSASSTPGSRPKACATTTPPSRLPVPHVPRGLPRPIAEDALLTAVAAAPPRVRPWLVLAGWAGLRAREIAFLRRENILDTAVAAAADRRRALRERRPGTRRAPVAVRPRRARRVTGGRGRGSCSAARTAAAARTSRGWCPSSRTGTSPSAGRTRRCISCGTGS